MRAIDAAVGEIPAGDAEALIRTANRVKQIVFAADVYDPAREIPGLLKAAAAGGLPESALLTNLGRIFAAAGIASDALTVMSPDGDGAVEQNVNRSVGGSPGQVIRGSASTPRGGRGSTVTPCARRRDYPAASGEFSRWLLR